MKKKMGTNKLINLLVIIAMIYTGELFGQTPVPFSTAGNNTWQCPAGVTSIDVECWGGGGGGGSTTNKFTVAGGGAGGSYIKHKIAVTPGTTYKLTVGDGGASTLQGQSSFFGNSVAGNSADAVVLAVGGAPGGANPNAGTNNTSYNFSNGGIGSTTGNIPNSGYTTNTAGANGTTPAGGATTTSGAGGTGANGGAGAATVTVTNNEGKVGLPGTAPGGGASGAASANNAGDNAGGTGGAGKIIITIPPLPTITSLSTSNACSGSGSIITITGTNFTGASFVKFNGTTASFSITNSTTISAILPNGATTGTIIVTTPGGTATSGVFTVNPVPTAPAAITSNSPQCAGTGITFTQGTCSSGTCYWVSSAMGTETTNSSATYVTNTTAGTYNSWVRAYNGSCWSTDVTTTGTINTPPSITGQPANQSVNTGAGIATFTVATTGSGLSYQWQEYTSSWVDISNGGVYSGTTSASLTITNPSISMNGNKYRCVISGCPPSVTTNGNATLTVTICTPTTSSINGNDIITKVSLTNSESTNYSNTTTSNGTTNYESYNNSPLDLRQGSNTNSLAITFGADGTQYSAAWIDFNQNQVFEASENIALSAISSGANATINYAFTVPAGATLGQTRMRIRGGSDAIYTTNGACTTTSYGETEDYLVNITAPATCFTPTTVSSSAITSSSATISWTAASPAPSNGYEWEVRTSGAAGSGAIGRTATGTVGAGIVTANVSGLASGTTNNVYVRSYCGGTDYSPWTAIHTFNTPCNNYALNVTEGFNSGTIPMCWSQQLVNGTSNIEYVTGAAAGLVPEIYSTYEGSNMIRWNSYAYISGQQTRLVSPPITTTGTSSVDVEFEWYNSSNNSGFNDAVQLQYSLDGSSWTNLGAEILRYNAAEGWVLKTNTLPAGAANQGTIYVGFLFTSRYGANCFMDAIVVKPTPIPCVAPTAAPTVLNLTPSSSSISVSFTTASPVADQYLVVRSTSNTLSANPVDGTLYTAGAPLGGGTVVKSSSSTSFTDSGLNPNTTYYYFIFSFNNIGCTGGPTYYTATSLMGNGITCPGVPTALNITSANSGGVTIGWAAPANGATDYTVDISATNFGSSIATLPQTTSSSSLVVSGLSESTIYYYKIRSNSATCSSAYTAVTQFSTTPVNDNCSGAIAINPDDVFDACTPVNGSLAGATNSGFAAPTGYADDDVWYSFVAEHTSQIITLGNTGGSDLVTQFVSGSACASFANVSYYDSDPTRQVWSDLTVGTTYYIRVYSYGNTPITGAASQFTICVGAPPVPASDLCGNAIDIAVGSSLSYATYDNIGATETAGVTAPDCGGAVYKDVWFKFVVPASGRVLISTEESNMTGKLVTGAMAIYSGNCGSLTLIECNNPSNMPKINHMNLPVGSTVYVRWWDFNGNDFGTFKLGIKEEPAPPASASNLPANDNCISATTIGNLNGYYGNTSSSYTVDGDGGDLLDNYCGTLENNSWLKFTADSATAVLKIFVSSCMKTNGIQMRVYETSNCNLFSPVSNCWSPAVMTDGTIVANGLTIGNDYYLMIDGYGGDICNYVISASKGIETLPVELLNFTARCNITNRTINWSTATENNASHFTVQSSTDGESWNDVNTIDAAGNSTQALQYQITDKNKYPTDVVYYKLLQFDYDGKSNVYGPIVSNCSNLVDNFQFFYHDNNLNINIKNSTSVVLFIYDSVGALIDQRKIIDSSIIDFSIYSNGIYFMKVQIDATTQTYKIVKCMN